jgi:hypothetical protein
MIGILQMVSDSKETDGSDMSCMRRPEEAGAKPFQLDIVDTEER